MEKKTKKTFLLPYVSLVSFILPSLLVIAYVRPTAGYSALVISGWFAAIQASLVAIMILATICAFVYLWRAEGKAGRVAVVVALVAMWSMLVYAIR